MIEKMQKYSFLVYHKEYDRFVEDLYNIGVVDVINKEINSVVNEKLDDKISLIKQYAAATSFLNKKSKLQLPDNVNVDYVPSEDSILTINHARANVPATAMTALRTTARSGRRFR